MVTRVRCLLPFILHVPESQLEPFVCEFEGHRVRVAPPFRTEGGAESRLGDRFPPAETQATGDVLFDRRRTVGANVFEFEFLEADSDRAENVSEPRVGVALRLLSGIIDRFRGLSHAPMVSAVGEHDVCWSVEYLSDARTELAPQPGLVRFRGQAQIRLGPVVVVAPEIWAAVQTQGRPTTAVEHLLLDAVSLLPQVGPALVLAHTAIEVRIATALEFLSASHPNLVSGELWHWINEGRDNPRMIKRPSVREQLNALLHCFTGRRLKDSRELWRDFERLNNARNKFVHEGRARIGGEDVTVAEGARLVDRARNVVDWIENDLPETERQERVALPSREISVSGRGHVPPAAQS